MNKKVEGLVERVRLTDEEISQSWYCAKTGGLTLKHRARFVAEAQLNKVLNDPDLALIDRKKVPDELDCVDCLTPEDKECYQCYIYEGFGKAIRTGYLPVIPLAEALKRKYEH